MDPQDTIDFSREALNMVAIVGGPILVAGLVIGLIVGIFQAMTQIQDQTVSAVPKILGMLLVTMLVLPWVGERMIEYTQKTLSKPMMGGVAAVTAAEPSPFQFASATTRLTPAYQGAPVARIAGNLPPLVPPALKPPTTGMPTLAPQRSSMPIHPYQQTPGSPAVVRPTMPQMIQPGNRNRPQTPVKQIDLEG
jgi:flagellar biosynthetic protein FliQ